jgi:hypothetical protein
MSCPCPLVLGAGGLLGLRSVPDAGGGCPGGIVEGAVFCHGFLVVVEGCGFGVMEGERREGVRLGK